MTGKLYRIYTESSPEFDKHTKAIVAKYFEAFTILKANGQWRGKTENSIVIEILTKRGRDIQRIARQIKLRNNQESVLIVSSAIDFELG